MTFHSIDGKTRVLGLIGANIAYSLSPEIHNFSIRKLGLNQVYLPFDTGGGLFPDRNFFRVMWDIGAQGFNITVPWKEVAASAFSDHSFSSINTVYRGQSGWEVDSTDGPGFARGLLELGVRCEDFKEVIFLGNGGAALGIYDFLRRKKLEQSYIVLRRNSRRDYLWQGEGSKVCLIDFSVESLSRLLAQYRHALLIQCTNAPQNGDGLEALLPALAPFEGTFVDLLYSKTSALLTDAQKKGLPAQDGLAMLIGQALLAQDLWWGQSMEFKAVNDHLREKFPGAK